MNLEEHWIIAKIDTVNGKPVIGDQLLIDGQAVFESLEQCLTALSTIAKFMAPEELHALMGDPTGAPTARTEREPASSRALDESRERVDLAASKARTTVAVKCSTSVEAELVRDRLEQLLLELDVVAEVKIR